MADAIVSIALERLANIVEDKIGEEIGLVRGVKEEVRYLSSELTAVRNVLEDAEKRGYKEKSIQNWLNKLEDISHDVDDVLDEWNFAILKHQIEGSKNFVGPRPKVCSFIPFSCLCFKKVATRRGIGMKIKGLRERLDVTVKEKNRYDFIVGEVVDHQGSDRVRSTSSVDVKEIQGREADKDVLVSKLIPEGVGQESSPNVISIVGTGGIGKTTVAQLVFKDDKVTNFFELRIWICVSDVFDEVRIAKGIMEIVKGSSPDVHELEALLKSMTDSISGKRFLLVLDDVWTEDYTKWEPMKNSLNSGCPGSKILVTTRSERVARMMGTIETHHLGQLSDINCWHLMRRIAFSGRSEGECEVLNDIGKNIANKCKGLPLAAKVLGSLLRFKDTVEDWENVLNSEIWQLEEAEVDLFPHLLLSYNELSSAMKRCFSYCAIFPKDFTIDVENLIRMWMALGYLGFGGSQSDLELRGKEYFHNLRMRSFFQDFLERDGKMSCKMHDIVHDFAQFLMKRKSHNLEDLDGGVKARKKGSCRVSQIKVYRSLFHPEELPVGVTDSVTCLRVLSLSNFTLRKIKGYMGNLIHLRYLDLRGQKLTVQVLQTICNLYNLQTLYLQNCGLEEIPKEMENLIHLKFLDLTANKLTVQVLQTICKLYNLQALYLHNCGLTEIPKEMGNLIHLRHLDLSLNIYIEELPETICDLHNLRTLNLEHCARLSRLPKEIHRLINLRHLINNFVDDTCQIPQGIEQLTALRSLRLFQAGRGQSKLGYLKKLNQLSGSLELRITLQDEEDVMEAKKAELRSKKHIRRLKIWFFNRVDISLIKENRVGISDVEKEESKPDEEEESRSDEEEEEESRSDEEEEEEEDSRSDEEEEESRLDEEEEGESRSDEEEEEDRTSDEGEALLKQEAEALLKQEEEALLKHEAMEALQPHPNLHHLTILDYQGIKFPNWISSSLNLLRVLQIHECNYCLTLPPLGKLPCLEEFSVWRMERFQFLSREFLGISGNNDGSMPSSAVVIGFPKLKKLSFRQCYSWEEWEDITAEEAMNTALSIMPCLQELYINACELTALPHRLLHKASALENLKIKDSLYLSQLYEDKNGSGWSSISHIPHVIVEYIQERRAWLSYERPLPEFHP